MQLSPKAEGYRQDILNYSARSYTRTLFFGHHYRFLVELLRADETHLSKQYHDLEAYFLAHRSVYGLSSDGAEQHQRHSYSYTQLQDLVSLPSPGQGQGQVLFLNGHLPGSWIYEVGAKYGIAPEFFRRHVHLWRSTHGPVLHAIARTPSATSSKGLLLRLNTQGYSIKNKLSMSPSDGFILQARRRLLPDDVEWMPRRLPAAPGGSYIRKHAYLSNLQFVIEQDISITIESNGDGCTAILWTDVGSQYLSKSHEYHHFSEHMTAKTETGHRDIRMLPVKVLGMESAIKHPWPLPILDSDDSKAIDGSLFQTASHLPSELHIMLDDHAIAGQDPLYALAPVLLFAAASENQLLSALQRWHDIIVSTKWNRKDSTEHLEQLILHKHLLDDHANRHEDVLRFISSPRLARWASNLTPEQSAVAQESKDAVRADYEFLVSRYRQLSLHYQEAISVLVSATSLAESQKQITLATQVTKLTILATVFLPLSYCTSIFGMNFVELDRLSIWIWVVVTVSIGLATFAVYQWDERQRLYDYWAIVGGKFRLARWRRGSATTV
ncbi:hypothetical protein G6011_09389 [Alternaria panax]|uniref:Uncharacterized protein n=1 Tax=Alternaria panax TaxID=48097 RepID=A0AAD4NMJ2_9PLEO|nr:hypothetical protein G6011_09389 [Alternaria panax]